MKEWTAITTVKAKPEAVLDVLARHRERHVSAASLGLGLVLDDHVDVDVGVGQRREDLARDARLVGDAEQRHPPCGPAQAELDGAPAVCCVLGPTARRSRSDVRAAIRRGDLPASRRESRRRAAPILVQPAVSNGVSTGLTPSLACSRKMRR